MRAGRQHAESEDARAAGATSTTGGLLKSYTLSGGVVCDPVSAPTSNLEIVNSTIAGNRGTSGGLLVENGCSATLRNVTVTGNETHLMYPGRASAGGLTVYPTGSARLGNTILADNLNTIDPSAPDCGASVASANVTIQSMGSNLIGALGHCVINSPLSRADLVGIPPLLAALADNGSPTQTLLPQVGSPALGAGSPDSPNDASDAACSHVDQRGQSRAASCDIGAVEVP